MSDFGSSAFSGQAFLVFRCIDRFATPQYLCLDGPFAYPRWTQTPEDATQLPLGMASGWAEALKFGPTDNSTRPVPAADVMSGITPPPTPTWQAEQDAWKKKRAELEAEAKARGPDTKREGWEGWSPFSGI